MSYYIIVSNNSNKLPVHRIGPCDTLEEIDKLKAQLHGSWTTITVTECTEVPQELKEQAPLTLEYRLVTNRKRHIILDYILESFGNSTPDKIWR